MSNNALTEKEEKLARMLKAICPDRDFVIPATLSAIEDGLVDNCIEFIENHPEADDSDVLEFLTADLPELEIVHDEE